MAGSPASSTSRNISTSRRSGSRRPEAFIWSNKNGGRWPPFFIGYGMSLFPRDFRENPHGDNHERRQEHDRDFRPMLTDRVLVEIGGERDEQHDDRQRGLDREGHRRSPYKAGNF